MGIHWYHWNPTFLWKFNLMLVRSRISVLIWDLSGVWNRSDGRDYREKRIVISRFLALYHHIEIPFGEIRGREKQLLQSYITYYDLDLRKGSRIGVKDNAFRPLWPLGSKGWPQFEVLVFSFFVRTNKRITLLIVWRTSDCLSFDFWRNSIDKAFVE